MSYGIAYFISTKMKNELKRFGLERTGALIATLEISGALGLLLGFRFELLLLISAGGLSILMLFALLFRIKSKDSLWVSLPAAFFMILNAFIFFNSIRLSEITYK
jgi:hypothetical protein